MGGRERSDPPTSQLGPESGPTLPTKQRYLKGHRRNVESPSLPFFFFVPLQIHHPSKIKFTNYSTNNIIDTKIKIYPPKQNKRQKPKQATFLNCASPQSSVKTKNHTIILLRFLINFFSFFSLVVT